MWSRGTRWKPPPPWHEPLGGQWGDPLDAVRAPAALSVAEPLLPSHPTPGTGPVSTASTGFQGYPSPTGRVSHRYGCPGHLAPQPRPRHPDRVDEEQGIYRGEVLEMMGVSDQK